MLVWAPQRVNTFLMLMRKAATFFAPVHINRQVPGAGEKVAGQREQNPRDCLGTRQAHCGSGGHPTVARLDWQNGHLERLIESIGDLVAIDSQPELC